MSNMLSNMAAFWNEQGGNGTRLGTAIHAMDAVGWADGLV